MKKVKIIISIVTFCIISTIIVATTSYYLNKKNVKNDFSDLNDIIFESQSFDYDEMPHSVYIDNIDEKYQVEYSNNNQINVGSYEVIATISYNNSEVKTLEAILTIIPSDLKGISFSSKEVEYDGFTHSVFVSNLPEYCTVSYENNDKSNSATYEVKAHIIDKTGNHNKLTLVTTLKIKPKELEVPTLVENLVYTGSKQAIELLNFDSNVMTITGNENVNAGDYQAHISLKDTTNYVYKQYFDGVINYKIAKAKYDLSSISFNDLSVEYSGMEHVLEINGDLPEGVSVEYTNNRLINVGELHVTATFTGDYENYEKIDNLESKLSVLKAKLNVKFLDETYSLDGNDHSIQITGELPGCVTVTYQNNNQYKEGEYLVLAIFTDSSGNYDTTTLEATMNIVDDGSYHQLIFKIGNEEEVYFVKHAEEFLDIPALIERDGYYVSWNFDFSSIIESAYLEMNYKVIDYEVTYHTNIDHNNFSKFNVESTNFDINPLELDEGFTFIGWYLNPEFIGDKVLNLKGVYNNVDLYPYILEHRITNTSYAQDSFSYKYVYPSSTLSIDLNTIFEVNEEASYKMFKDQLFDEEINSLTLEEGDNYFYVNVYNQNYYTSYIFNAYKTKTYKVSFIDDNNELSVTYYDELSVINEYTAISKLGYEFKGWYLDDKLVTFPYVVDKDTEFYANYQIIKYTITYHLNDGSNNINNPEAFTVLSDFEFEDASKKGYTFEGWYLDSSFSEAITKISIGSTLNKELFAKFNANTYTITYNLNGGELESSNSSVDVIYDNSFSLEIPTKTGYTFVSYTYLGENIDYSKYTFEEDIEVLATYQIINYKISYVVLNDTVNTNRTSYTILDSFEFTDPLTNGYEFDGWYKEGEFINRIYKIDVGQYGDISIYAKFIQTDFTISFLTEGVELDLSDITISYSQELNLDDLEVLGYDFLGYYYNDEKFTYQSYPFNHSITLVAKFSPISVNIKYYLNQSIIKEDVATYDSLYTIINASNDSNITTTWDNNGNEVKNNTITSKFVEDQSFVFKEFSKQNVTYQLNDDGISAVSILNENFDFISSATIFDNEYFINEIEENIFDTDFIIKTVNIPSTISTLPNGVFKYLDNVEKISLSFPSNLSTFHELFGKTYLEASEIPSSLVDVTIYSNVLNANMFYGITSLQKVEYNANIIEESAFRNCSSLGTIKILEGATIGQFAFVGCANLSDIYFEESLETYMTRSFKNQTFVPSYNGSNVYCENVLVTQVSITKDVSPYMFYGFNSVENIIIHDGVNVSSIGEYSFAQMKNLTTISIPNTVKNVGKFAFYGDESITEITLNGVEIISESVFENCTNLSNFVFSTNTNTIEKRAFYNTKIKQIFIPETILQIKENAFDKPNSNLSKIQILVESEYTPTGFEDGWDNGATVYLNSLGVITEDGVSYLISNDGASVIDYNSTNKIVDLSESITYQNNTYSLNSIAGYAFGNKDIETVNIPNSVSLIEAYAFYNSQIKYIYLKSTISTIENGAFSNCNLIVITDATSKPKTWNLGYLKTYYNVKNQDYTIVSDSLYILEDNAYTLAFYFGNEDTYQVLDQIDEISVTRLGESAFESSNVKVIYLPKTIIALEEFCLDNLILETIYYSGTLEDFNNIQNDGAYSNEPSIIAQI